MENKDEKKRPRIGYARVSTSEQTVDPQIEALERAGCSRIFTDPAISGAKEERPGLKSALAFVREGDDLVVWKLDRLSRSLSHLIETVTDLAKRDVGFISITEAMDTSTNGGRLIFHVFGALAEFERDLIRERTKAGLDSAKAKGNIGGRRPVMTADRVKKAETLLKKGLSVPEVATRIKVSKSSLYNAINSGMLKEQVAA